MHNFECQCVVNQQHARNVEHFKIEIQFQHLRFKAEITKNAISTFCMFAKCVHSSIKCIFQQQKQEVKNI